jgi:MoaA/NifB/PqqE/SkfB family radical SAM enzyme
MIERLIHAGVRSVNVSIDGPQDVHDKIRGRDGAFERTRTHLEALVAQRERYGLKIRMNFTVMRDNVSALPQIAMLSQEIGVRLYLNLATDHTFLFQHPDVSEETQVAEPELAAALERLEQLARHDRQWLPRYSDLAYIPRHFHDVVQRDLPCAESQLKLMIHSRGEIGGCWGHNPAFSVRDTPIATVVASAHYREEHTRLFRKECVGCGSNYSLNLRWRPRTYVEDVLWRLGWRRLA